MVGSPADRRCRAADPGRAGRVDQQEPVGGSRDRLHRIDQLPALPLALAAVDLRANPLHRRSTGWGADRRIASGVGLAWATYEFVEKRVRRLGRVRRPCGTAGLASAAVGTSAVSESWSSPVLLSRVRAPFPILLKSRLPTPTGTFMTWGISPAMLRARYCSSATSHAAVLAAAGGTDIG